MSVLENVWEGIGSFFNGLGRGFERSVTSLFGSANARVLKRLQPQVEAINVLETKYQAMSNEQLKQQTAEFRKRLDKGQSLDDLLIETFAVCREASIRYLGMRHYDVQLMGGMVLHEGNIAEMVTGEGKTLVATLASYLNALDGKNVHVVTVNDYLARRDMEWMGALHQGLGLTVSAIQSGMDSGERQKSYASDITYGTNNEFGFDYLRDNMRPAARDDERYEKHLQQSQGRLNYAIIDEVDNILIDEARTPLIISGPAMDDVNKYCKADKISRRLIKGKHFEVKEKEHSCNMTDEGIRAAEKMAEVESFYTAGNMHWPHLIDNSLKAHHLYRLDVNYVIQDQEIVIVDEFTGRLMPGRNWSDGLHQAVEAKEGVRVKEENQTLATITLQNFFKLYNKISGMTGTAMTEATEFWKIYKLDVIAIPTNRPMRRDLSPDIIYRSEREKFTAIADEIEQLNKWHVLEMTDGTHREGTVVKEDDQIVEFQQREAKRREKVPLSSISKIQRPGRPILVGTVSIEKSERLSGLLSRRGVPHEVLNAKHHKREAEIVAQAGSKSSVTIATNMAGRGTDIVLGGNAESMAWAELQDQYETRLDVPKEEWDAQIKEIEIRENLKENAREVVELGGLYVIGSERHEARRIDLQLRGRCGRQGDPGGSRFFLSLEDDLMRIFAGEWVRNILTRLGMKEGEAIESRMVSRRIEGAQKKVEERNFEIRKDLLEYDEVMDEQRKRVYGYRQRILDGESCRELIVEMIEGQIDHHLDEYLDIDYGSDSFAKWSGSQLAIELDSRDFRRLDFNNAQQYALDQAERMRESQVLDSMDENLPEDADPDEWNWAALAKTANTVWHLSVRDRDLKKIGRENLAEHMIQQSREALGKIDLSEGERFLDEGFGIHTACAWVEHKFGFKIDPVASRELEPEEFKRQVHENAQQAYNEREFEYPVMAGLQRFTTRGTGGHERYDREKLAAWARDRFAVKLDIDDLRNKQREEIRELLLAHSRNNQRQAIEAREDLERRLENVFPDGSGDDASDQRTGTASHNGRLSSLSDVLDDKFHCKLTVEELAKLDRDSLQKRLCVAVDDRFHPEIRKMERALVLEILDTGWKDHLLVMDHLRSSVGLRGYAQIDPKVEYKREGMRLFDGMWTSIGERVTDLIFRMEQLDDDFVSSTWTESEAVHEEASSAIAAQQAAALEGGQEDHKLEPIRNIQQRVGRNAPCPCGSGKKYKNCCMRKSV